MGVKPIRNNKSSYLNRFEMFLIEVKRREVWLWLISLKHIIAQVA